MSAVPSTPTTVPTTSKIYNDQDIITLANHPGYLTATDPGLFGKSYSNKPPWRYFDNGEPVDMGAHWVSECLTETSEVTFVGTSGSAAWHIEVGRLEDESFSDGGKFVWRSIFTAPTDWRSTHRRTDLKEPEELTRTMTDVLHTFAVLREKWNIDSEDHEEILGDLGLFSEGRVKVAMESVPEKPQGGKSEVVHIVPADYTLLQKRCNLKPSSASTYSYETDPFDRLHVSRREKRVAPSYFWQVKPTPGTGVKYLDVVADAQRSGRDVTTKCSLVMPWDVEDIEDVPDWLIEMLSGDGEYSERWRRAQQDAVDQFEAFDRRIESGWGYDADGGLLECLGPSQDKSKVLNAFVCTYLTRELGSITASAEPTSTFVPRVSSMAALPYYSLTDVKRTGLFSPSDLGPSRYAGAVLRVIEFSEHLAEEAAEREARWQERRDIARQEDEEKLPTYEEAISAPRVGQRRRWEP